MKKYQLCLIFLGEGYGVWRGNRGSRIEISGKKNTPKTASAVRTPSHGRSTHEYGNSRSAKNFFRRRTQQGLLESSPTVSSQYDQIDVATLHKTRDSIPQAGPSFDDGFTRQ